MEESYSEDLASHTGPELYADGGNVVGVATTGVYTGQLSSSEITHFRVPTPSAWWEGHTCSRGMASDWTARRSRRT
jgi:hypothetical protein